jgi:surfeit locus 1 family protein
VTPTERPGQGELKRRGIVAPTLVTLAALVALIALGTWQLDRKAWKEGLIDSLRQRLDEAPALLPPRETWARLHPFDMEFRRVSVPLEFVADEEALVYTSGSAFRPDVRAPGYWVFTPARPAAGGLVVVNRGFVPEGKQDPKTRNEGRPRGLVTIAGVMRWPEQRGFFTPKDDPNHNLWFVRDPVTIAEGKNWGKVAPFYLEQEAPPAPGGLPQVGRVEPNLPNNHLQYAITWYGLAVVLVILFGFLLRSRWREARAGSDGVAPQT